MLVKFKPSDVSRDEVQVVLRASTSTSPDCSAVKRSFAVSGTNFTLVASLKIAAASALQKSTSRPAQRPCESGRPKPASVPLDPQLSTPRCLTVLSVWAEAADAAIPRTAASAARITTLFMTKTPKPRAPTLASGALMPLCPTRSPQRAITERSSGQVKGLRLPHRTL